MPKTSKECIDARVQAGSAKSLLIAGIIVLSVPIVLMIIFDILPVGIAILVIVFLYYGGWLFGIAGIIMLIFGITLTFKERSACSM